MKFRIFGMSETKRDVHLAMWEEIINLFLYDNERKYGWDL